MHQPDTAVFVAADLASHTGMFTQDWTSDGTCALRADSISDTTGVMTTCKAMQKSCVRNDQHRPHSMLHEMADCNTPCNVD